mgnify:CR=1 FL=1|jgi:phosphocarrier protein HPr|tara:strand:- start:300 stop:569 length:270 start_codon:yes stop_codon:yes gene_type:complete
MIKKKIKIINKLGLHARASSKLTQLACNFSSEIFLVLNKNKVNVKSIMEVLMLAASQNTIVLIEANGPDEKKAISEIEKLFNNFFGENE